MSTFEIVCGGAQPELPPESRTLVRLNSAGPAQNVNLRITDISKAMLATVPDVLVDLLEIAAYVYCADQQCPRGSELLAGFGRDWRRQMHFVVPVRQPDLWNSVEVAESLREMLGFLSDDFYTFSFGQAPDGLPPRERYFDEFVEGGFEPDEIALFSGGLDSFAGAVAEAVGEGKRLALVGHRSAPQVFNVQRELVADLKRAGLGRQLFYAPVNVTNANVPAREGSQRTRSFLFASLALVIARMFGRRNFTFYENGVVSLNLPLDRDVLGARATRTTHPRAIQGFEEFFSAVLGSSVEIRTPFQWLTKKEVLQLISEHGFAGLIARTNSCANPRSWTRDVSHCGVCSQCVDRRFSILAAGLEEFDPAENYGVDLLLGPRTEELERRMAVSYVKFFQNFAALEKRRFLPEHPAVTTALRSIKGMRSEEALSAFHELYRGHAEDVLRVLEDGAKRHAGELVRGAIPAGSILSMCAPGTRIETQPPSDYDRQTREFMDALSEPRCEFAVDERSKRIVFAGGFVLTGANYSLVHVLIGNFRSGKESGCDVPFMRPDKLAKSLRIDQQSLRQQIGRLRKVVSERLAVDQGIVPGTDGFIENRPGEGYRISPALREVFLSDIAVPPRDMSHG